MSSTDTLGRLHRVCTRRRSLTGWFFAYPPSLHQPSCATYMIRAIEKVLPLHKSNHHISLTMKTVGADHSPPVEGWQAQPDGVVFCVPTIFTPTAPRHPIMVTVNEMDRMDCPYRHNALGWGYKSAPTAYEILFQQPLIAAVVHKSNHYMPLNSRKRQPSVSVLDISPPQEGIVCHYQLRYFFNSSRVLLCDRQHDACQKHADD